MKFFKKIIFAGILVSATGLFACSEDSETQDKSTDSGNSDADADADSDTDSDSDVDSDSQGNEGDPVTALDSARLLNALNETEVTQLCNDTWAYYERTIPAEVFCKWKGVSYATSSSPHSEEQLISNCSSTEGSCLNNPTEAWSGNPGCNAPNTDCAATVAQYSLCIKDTAADFIAKVNSMLTCDVFTFDGTNSVWDLKGADRVPSCLMTECMSLWPADPKNI